mgnify:CR=1 FL=1
MENMRPLTREEQLKWTINFLEKQIQQMEQELNEYKKELNELEQQQKIKIKKI